MQAASRRKFRVTCAAMTAARLGNLFMHGLGLMICATAESWNPSSCRKELEYCTELYTTLVLCHCERHKVTQKAGSGVFKKPLIQ